MCRFTLLVLAAAVAISQCHASSYTVDSVTSLVQAVTDATNKNETTITLKLTQHLTLNDTINLQKLNSVAIVGACTTSAPRYEDADVPAAGSPMLPLAAPGACGILFNSTKPLISTSWLNWRQLYFENVALQSFYNDTQLVFGEADVWLIASSLNKFKVDAYNASMFLVDSSIVGKTGLGATLGGEASAIVVQRSTIVTQLYVDLIADSETAKGSIVSVQGTANTTGINQLVVSANLNGDISLKNDTVIRTPAGLPTNVVVGPVAATYTYPTVSANFLANLKTEGVAMGVDKAISPFTEVPMSNASPSPSTTPTPTPTPSTTPSTASPGSTPSPTTSPSPSPAPISGAAWAKTHWAVAAALAAVLLHTLA